MSDSTLSARFPDAYHADVAVDALVAAGVAREAISVSEQNQPGGSEGRFLWRLVVTIVLWSIPGGAVGAAAGLALALAGIGPDGATGTAVQVTSWLIAGHLLAGMWAGYVFLADRTSPQMTPDRSPGVVVSVRCGSEGERETVRQALRLPLGKCRGSG